MEESVIGGAGLFGSLLMTIGEIIGSLVVVLVGLFFLYIIYRIIGNTFFGGKWS